MVFLAVKDTELTPFKLFLKLETKEISFALPQMTSVPTSLTAKKTMNMKFFSKKIYCISSRNVPNITNMHNPKWLHVHFIDIGYLVHRNFHLYCSVVKIKVVLP